MDFIFGHVSSSPHIICFSTRESVSKHTYSYPNPAKDCTTHLNASAYVSNTDPTSASFLAPAYTRFPRWSLITHPTPPPHVSFFQDPSILHLKPVGAGGYHCFSGDAGDGAFTSIFLTSSLLFHSFPSSLAFSTVAIKGYSLPLNIKSLRFFHIRQSSHGARSPSISSFRYSFSNLRPNEDLSIRSLTKGLVEGYGYSPLPITGVHMDTDTGDD